MGVQWTNTSPDCKWLPFFINIYKSGITECKAWVLKLLNLKIFSRRVLYSVEVHQILVQIVVTFRNIIDVSRILVKFGL